MIEGRCIPERHVDHTLMDPGREGGDGRAFLPAAHGGCADEEAEVFAVEGARLPEVAKAVDEGFPLRGVVAVAGGDAEQEGVVFGHVVRFDGRDGGVFWGGVLEGLLMGWWKGDGLGTDHLGENFLGESLSDLKDVYLAAGGFNAGLLGVCQLLDVAIHGPVDDSDTRSHDEGFLGRQDGKKSIQWVEIRVFVVEGFNTGEYV